MFVGGVKPETTDETLRGKNICSNRTYWANQFAEYFGAFGEIEELARPVNKETGQNKPFCFIVFKRDGVIGECLKSKCFNLISRNCKYVSIRQVPRDRRQTGRV